MPWFLNPYIYQQLSVHRNPELYLFILKIAATAAFAVLLRRQRESARRTVALTAVFFYGTFLTVMLLMHSGVILGLYLFGRPDAAAQPYNFHLYSLVLLGAVLIFQGVSVLRAVFRLKAGGDDAAGAQAATRATLIVLAVAVPLIPIQFFGTVLTVFSLVNLAALKLVLPRSAVAAENPLKTDGEMIGAAA